MFIHLSTKPNNTFTIGRNVGKIGFRRQNEPIVYIGIKL